jgi:hypothetical protein
MLTLANLSSFLGSVWFGLFTACAGYIFAHIFPIKVLMEKFHKK